MRPTSIYDGKAHSVLLLRAPVEKSRPSVSRHSVGALMRLPIRLKINYPRLTQPREARMADAPVVQIGENSREHLMHDIAAVENKVLHQNPGPNKTVADRKWILSTYAACFQVAVGGKAPAA
jgi:hypothetical protein